MAPKANSKLHFDSLESQVLMTQLNVNNTVRTVEAEADTPLLWVIREQLGLTGTK